MAKTIDQMKALFDEHRNVVTIAQAENVSRQAVYKWIKTSGFDYDRWKKENGLLRASRTSVARINNTTTLEYTSSTNKIWVLGASNYNFTVYTLDIEGSIYVGYTGDLKARIYQHRDQFWNKQNKLYQIISCEFFYDKLHAKGRMIELMNYYQQNGFQMENKQIPPYTGNDVIPPPASGEYHSSIYDTIPAYSGFIEWCRENPTIPFSESMVHNCEGSTRKHWRSIVKTTFDLLKLYMKAR